MSFTFRFSYALASVELISFYSFMNSRAHSLKKLVPFCKFANESEGSLEEAGKEYYMTKYFTFCCLSLCSCCLGRNVILGGVVCFNMVY